MGPILTIPPAIHSFYFFDPIGIRLEIVSDLSDGEQGFKLIDSVRQSDDELRRELAIFCDDPKWIEEMIALKGRRIADLERGNSRRAAGKLSKNLTLAAASKPVKKGKSRFSIFYLRRRGTCAGVPRQAGVVLFWRVRSWIPENRACEDF